MFIEIDLEKIKNQLLTRRSRSIESILSKFNWQCFESAVAGIFSANSFFVSRNLRFKTKRRYEIDIVASRHGNTLSVDCKGWGNGRYKNSALIRAAEKQFMRTKELKKFVSKNPIAEHKLQITKNSKLYPMLVTLHDEAIEIEENILIIPVWKLNSFLNTF